MKKTLLIDSMFHYERSCVLQNNELVEIVIEKKDSYNIGDIFVCRVNNILKNKFAFLNIGYEKDAFLDIQDNKDSTSRIRNGQDIIVQIQKDETDIKGANVTTKLTITGKYVVILLTENAISLSKKIDDTQKRAELKSLAKDTLPEKYGVIFRTNCIDTTLDTIKLEFTSLIKKADNLLNTGQFISPPARLYSANTQTEKIIIDTLKENDEIIVNTKHSYDKYKALFENISLYEDNLPIFETYSIESKIKSSLNNKVWLKSGGFLVINRTEAMTVIDVNTGKNIKKNFNEMATKTNIEAIETCLKEIRARNISGIILIDFIDLKKQNNNAILEDLFKKLARKDRMPIVSYPINELGIMYITRKKNLNELLDSISKDCPMCLGSGRVLSEDYIAHEIKNKIISIFSNTIYKSVTISSNSRIINSLKNGNDIESIKTKFNRNIILNIIQTGKFDYFEIDKV